MKELRAILQHIAPPEAFPAVLATLVEVRGSSYRRTGARLLITAAGERVGSISGGCLEEDLIERMHRVRGTGRAEVVVYDTTDENDLVWGVGLGCNGVVHILLERLEATPAWAQTISVQSARRLPTALAVIYGPGREAHWGTYLEDAAPVGQQAGASGVFQEIVQPPTPLVIGGAGDDAQPLVRLAKELGWHVTVIDPRPAFATPSRFPGADVVIAAPPRDLARHVTLDERTVAVIMTHHYVHDLPLLRVLLAGESAYLGLLGPKKRAEKLLADLTAEGLPITREQRARLHAPVGLDLGGDAPEAVALAIIAEIQATLARRDARPLRDRTRPIHDERADP